jgi:hypothetical protein
VKLLNALAAWLMLIVKTIVSDGSCADLLDQAAAVLIVRCLGDARSRSENARCPTTIA